MCLPLRPRGPISSIWRAGGNVSLVSSIEDEEFRERALGGPDTTTRLRRNWRVRVLAGANATDRVTAGADMRAAIVQRLTGLTSDPDQWFDAAKTTFVSQGKLQITPIQATSTDPCKPASVTGFIGAENQTLRVQQTAMGRFIWGLDDAGPLFRVKPDPNDATRTRLLFLTTPRDAASFPIAGQAIELLPWGAMLDNGCIAAEATGTIFSLGGNYNPSTGR